MSLADPLSVTISGVTSSLPKTQVEGKRSIYTSGDGLIVVTASHDIGKRQRSMLRLDTSKLAADPFRPSENRKVSMSTYVVLDVPVDGGYTDAEALAAFTGFKGLFGASDANITKLLAQEH